MKERIKKKLKKNNPTYTIHVNRSRTLKRLQSIKYLIKLAIWVLCRKKGHKKGIINRYRDQRALVLTISENPPRDNSFYSYVQRVE